MEEKGVMEEAVAEEVLERCIATAGTALTAVRVPQVETARRAETYLFQLVATT